MPCENWNSISNNTVKDNFHKKHTMTCVWFFFYTKRGKLYIDLLRHILSNEKCKTGKANYAHENLSFFTLGPFSACVEVLALLLPVRIGLVRTPKLQVNSGFTTIVDRSLGRHIAQESVPSLYEVFLISNKTCWVFVGWFYGDFFRHSLGSCAWALTCLTTDQYFWPWYFSFGSFP